MIPIQGVRFDQQDNILITQDFILLFENVTFIGTHIHYFYPQIFNSNMLLILSTISPRFLNMVTLHQCVTFLSQGRHLIRFGTMEFFGNFQFFNFAQLKQKSFKDEFLLSISTPLTFKIRVQLLKFNHTLTHRYLEVSQ